MFKNITQIIPTIQGEGPKVGIPSLLIRWKDCNLNCPFCLVGNTKIDMVDNEFKRIKDIKIGDEVISYNEKEKTLESKKVSNIFKRQVDSILEITMSNENGYDTIFVTDEHPLWVSHEGWTKAKDLTVGKCLYNLKPFDRIKFKDSKIVGNGAYLDRSMRMFEMWNTSEFGENEIMDAYYPLLKFFQENSELEIDKILDQFIHNGKLISKIKRIDKSNNLKDYIKLSGNINNMIDVFNIEVEDNHTYFSNGVLSHNCDTQWSNKHTTEIFNWDNINEYLSKYPKIDNIMLTGGEPFIYANKMGELLSEIDKRYEQIKTIEIESNGTLTNEETMKDLLTPLRSGRFKITINISPKLGEECYKHPISSSEIIKRYQSNSIALNRLSGGSSFDYIFKIVYSEAWKPHIEEFLNTVHTLYDRRKPSYKVFIMPITPDFRDYKLPEEEINFIQDFRKSCVNAVEFCLEKGLKFSCREHVWIWFDKKNEQIESRR